MYGSYRNLEIATGVNRGTLHRIVYENGNSARLRRLWDIPVGPRRVRLTINCEEETIKRFDYLRGEMTRKEFLVMLLNKITL